MTMFHRSERLLLRPPWPEDWSDVYRGIADEGVVRNLAAAPWPYAQDDARSWCASGQDPRAPRFLITLAHTAEVIGCIGFGPLPVEDGGGDGIMEIGYWIARPHWGCGYASEATRAVIEIARTIGCSRIEAGHFVDNPASGRVLRKAGFLPTGKVAPRHSAGRGEDAPCILYRLDHASGLCASGKAA